MLCIIIHSQPEPFSPRLQCSTYIPHNLGGADKSEGGRPGIWTWGSSHRLKRKPSRLSAFFGEGIPCIVVTLLCVYSLVSWRAFAGQRHHHRPEHCRKTVVGKCIFLYSVSLGVRPYASSNVQNWLRRNGCNKSQHNMYFWPSPFP